ncbi:hypothetical protein IWW55_002374 [Coemansia sp. RSA 2706]|nr:hypothetical protein IWW55_002374 [Coemansia sp. RSA 2706]
MAVVFVEAPELIQKYQRVPQQLNLFLTIRTIKSKRGFYITQCLRVIFSCTISAQKICPKIVQRKYFHVIQEFFFLNCIFKNI